MGFVGQSFGAVLRLPITGVLAQLHEDSLLAMKARRSGMKGGMVIPGGTFNGRIESGPLLKESISRAWQNEMDNDLFDL